MPTANLQPYTNDAECVAALTQGRADAYVIDQSILISDAIGNPAVKVVGEPFTVDPYGIGVTKDDPSAKEFVNAWLKTIEDDGSWADLWKATIGTVVEGDAPAPPAIGSGSRLLTVRRPDDPANRGRATPCDIVLSNLSPLLAGLWITLSIAVLSFLGAMIIGTLVAVMRISPVAPLRAVGLVYVEFFRNIPLLCLLFLVVFGLPDIGVLFNLYNSAVIAMAMFSGAFVCESIRTGINTVQVGQAEAARSIGLTFPQSLRFVILPQALRSMVQPLVNVWIGTLIGSSLASVIGIQDVTAIGQNLNNRYAGGLGGVRLDRGDVRGDRPALRRRGRLDRAPGDGAAMRRFAHRAVSAVSHATGCSSTSPVRARCGGSGSATALIRCWRSPGALPRHRPVRRQRPAGGRQVERLHHAAGPVVPLGRAASTP